jgi:hypothetical protein
MTADIRSAIQEKLAQTPPAARPSKPGEDGKSRKSFPDFNPQMSQMTGIAAVHEAFVFEAWRAEVEQQAGRFQVVDDLRFLGATQLSQGLQLDDDLIEADEVRSV